MNMRVRASVRECAPICAMCCSLGPMHAYCVVVRVTISVCICVCVCFECTRVHGFLRDCGYFIVITVEM